MLVFVLVFYLLVLVLMVVFDIEVVVEMLGLVHVCPLPCWPSGGGQA